MPQFAATLPHIRKIVTVSSFFTAQPLVSFISWARARVRAACDFLAVGCSHVLAIPWRAFIAVARFRRFRKLAI